MNVFHLKCIFVTTINCLLTYSCFFLISSFTLNEMDIDAMTVTHSSILYCMKLQI